MPKLMLRQVEALPFYMVLLPKIATSFPRKREPILSWLKMLSLDSRLRGNDGLTAN